MNCPWPDSKSARAGSPCMLETAPPLPGPRAPPRPNRGFSRCNCATADSPGADRMRASNREGPSWAPSPIPLGSAPESGLSNVCVSPLRARFSPPPPSSGLLNSIPVPARSFSPPSSRRAKGLSDIIRDPDASARPCAPKTGLAVPPAEPAAARPENPAKGLSDIMRDPTRSASRALAPKAALDCSCPPPAFRPCLSATPSRGFMCSLRSVPSAATFPAPMSGFRNDSSRPPATPAPVPWAGLS